MKKIKLSLTYQSLLRISDLYDIQLDDRRSLEDEIRTADDEIKNDIETFNSICERISQNTGDIESLKEDLVRLRACTMSISSIFDNVRNDVSKCIKRISSNN